jgi:hypothetical protein
MVYRSRRKQVSRRYPKKKGGALVVPKHEDVHTSQHHPEDLVKVLQSVPEAASVAHKMLKEHAAVKKFTNVKTRFPRWKARIPDRSLDLHAFAKSIYKKHSYREMPRLGGSLSDVVNVAKKIGDPIQEAKASKDSYDGVNFHDTSFRGAVRSGLSAYGGNFHAASSHMKAASLIPGAQMIAPAAQAFSAVGYGFDKVRSII